ILDTRYILDMETNTSKTAGGDAADTPKKIRMMAGRLNMPLNGVKQSEEGEEDIGEGSRDLKVAERQAVKKRKALLDDSSLVIGLDSDYTQRRAIAGIVKGRFGGEGGSAEMLWIPPHGVVNELEIDFDDFDF